ncbi:MAG: HAMP domain-containing protein [Chlorobiaceae bacterium]|nr:HAMP domain-containing protein [Chlorobiaceae bacterium]
MAGRESRAPWSSMSLRNRMALYYTGATAVLMAIVFVVIFVTVDRVVYRHFDEELRHEVAETLSEAHVQRHDVCEFGSLKEIGLDEARDGRLNDPHRIRNVADIDPEFVQLVDSKGRVVSKTANLARNVLSFAPSYSGVRFFNTSLGASTMRQVQVPLVDRQGAIEGYLIVAVPLKSAMIVLRDLKYIVMASFPAIIILLFGLTRLIAGRSIRPVEEIISMAETINQESLERRIVLPRQQDELYRLGSTINGLLDRLQHAFQREKRFTADASHELRTPLAVVKGTLDVLVRKPREVDHYEERIRYCLNELNRMARLIDQLLMLARYENGDMNPQIVTIGLAGMLKTVTDRMEPMAVAKNISTRIERISSEAVAVDPAMLEIMLENLISNSIKYSPEGSIVEIRGGIRDGQQVCTIMDYGIGIPEEKLPYVFDRFYRVDESRSSNTGGFGLGLSIVRRLADLQGISVSVMSRERHGTTFMLTFPPVPN